MNLENVENSLTASESFGSGIEWAAISPEDLDKTAMNKISVKELMKKYPKKQEDQGNGKNKRIETEGY